jgi:hypothetical protein
MAGAKRRPKVLAINVRFGGSAMKSEKICNGCETYGSDHTVSDPPRAV